MQVRCRALYHDVRLCPAYVHSVSMHRSVHVRTCRFAMIVKARRHAHADMHMHIHIVLHTGVLTGSEQNKKTSQVQVRFREFT